MPLTAWGQARADALPPVPPPPQIAAAAVPSAVPAASAGAGAAAPDAAGQAAAAAPTRRRVASASAVPAHVTVVEDDGVRIEEARVRGQLTRVTVQSKLQGARPYDILVPPGGRDPSQERGVAGSSAWRLMSF
jgi:hypothetical protein